MAITTGTANVSGLWTTYILKKMVPMLKDDLLFARFSKPAMIPKHAGHTARWLKPQKFSGNVTPLVDASDGSANEVTDVTISNVEGTMDHYGEYMKVSDLAEMTEVSTALDAYTEQFAFAGADGIDTLIRTQAVTTTNFLHAEDTTVGGTTLAGKSELHNFATIAGFFHANNARGFSSIGGDYAYLMHPTDEVNLITHVAADELSWSEAMKNVPSGFQQLVDNHRFIGRYAGVSAFRTTKIENNISEDVTAYRNVALADYGVGWLGLGEKGPRKPTMKIKRPGPGDTSQPLDLFMTIGYKYFMVAKLIDAARVLNVYSAV